MSQWDKLLKRIKNLSSDLRFEELKKVLEQYGYTMYESKGGSSHCTFRKDHCNPLTIPRHKIIKKVYIQLVKRVVEQEESNENN